MGAATTCHRACKRPGWLAGTTMDQVFANFSVVATLDSDHSIYGYSNLQLNPACSGGLR